MPGIGGFLVAGTQAVSSFAMAVPLAHNLVHRDSSAGDDRVILLSQKMSGISGEHHRHKSGVTPANYADYVRWFCIA